MALRLAAETAKVILETKPNKIGFLTIRADGLVALALEWTDAYRAGQEEMRGQASAKARRSESGLASWQELDALPLEGDDEV